MNGVIAFYFWNILRGEWKTLPENGNFADVRRLYRYIWVLYGLLITVFGAQQILQYLFYVPAGVLGELGREQFINGLALLMVGTPVWIYAWRIVQDSTSDAAERESNLRLGVLYVLALGGVIATLTAASTLIDIVINKMLGAELSTADFIHQISGPISLGVPLGAVWAYYGHWLNRHIESFSDGMRQSQLKRLYYYVLSALGLGAAFTGIALLINFMIDILTGGMLMTDMLRPQLAAAISLILAWLPFWLMTWRPAQREAFLQSEPGDHARQAVVRKAYLYLALFAGVIGGMSMAVALVFELLKAWLTGQTDTSFLATILKDLQLLVLFGVLLLYHLNVLRRDSASTSDALAAKQKEFPVLVLDSGQGFAESVKNALAKSSPNVPVTIATQNPQGKFSAVIMAGSSAMNSAEWLRTFAGSRIIVPDAAQGVIWAGGISRSAIQQAAESVRQLTEGQEINQQTASGSAWRIVVFIAAALFGLELLFALVALIFSAFTGR